VLGQAVPDQPPQVGGHAADVRGVIDHPVHQRDGRPRAEWTLAGGGESEHRAQAEHVAGRAELAAQDLFGGHEPGRADPQVRARGGGPGGLGNAEVDDPRAVLGQQHVGRLQVPVHYSGGVDGAQALRQPGGQREQRADREWSVAAHRLGQRRPGHVGCRQPRHRAFRVRVDDERGEQAAHLLRGRDLLLELGAELGIFGQLGPDDLDRDGPPARGHPQEHLSHAAAAQLPEQPVGPDLTRIVRLQFGVPQCFTPNFGRDSVFMVYPEDALVSLPVYAPKSPMMPL
jgi:hypothetical protein